MIKMSYLNQDIDQYLAKLRYFGGVLLDLLARFAPKTVEFRCHVGIDKPQI
jgi:hypothetical protein